MKMKPAVRSLAAVLTFALMSLGVSAHAQKPMVTQERLPSLELTYDFVRTNGPEGNCGCIHLNGGGAAVVYPLRHSDFSLVGRLGATHGGGIGALGYDLTLFTYTAGARYLPRMRRSAFQPYVELQVGGVEASGSLANAPSLAGNGIGAAFAATAGGGVDLNLHKRISFKLIDAEYMATNYANGDSDHQNNLRIGAGVVLSFCRSGKCSASK
jgi:hypothetical protein